MAATPAPLAEPIAQEKGPVGRKLQRRDGRLKVTGAATYAAEWPVRGLCDAVIVPATIARGTLRSLDTRAALAHPGVLSVMTHENAPESGQPSFGFSGAASAGSPLKPLSGTRIHHEGQAVAVVVGETIEAATAGAALVRASYDAEDAACVFADHLDAAREAVPTNAKAPGADHGDVDAALAGAAHTLEAEYRTPQQHHNAIEPHATIAHWHDPDADGVRLTLFDSTQNIHGERLMLADLFGLAPGEVRVVCPFIGGAFGGKGGVWPHVQLTALAARFAGRPVRLVLMREQVYHTVGHRSPQAIRLKLGSDAAGKITAIDAEMIGHTLDADGGYVQSLGEPLAVMYADQNLRYVHKAVKLNVTTPCFMRAPAEAPSMFALESAVDELAEKAGVDPVEFRRANDIQANIEGKPFSQRRLMACFDRAAEHFGWADRNPAPRSTTDGRWRVGVGCAASMYPHFMFPTSAEVTLQADGSAVVRCGTHEMGGGTTTAQAQNAARLLGLPVERVSVEIGDTRFPMAPVSGGSNTTPSMTGAVRDAVEQLTAELLTLAKRDPSSPLAAAEPGAVRLEGGRLVLAEDPSKGVETRAILRGGYRDAVKALGRFSPPAPAGVKDWAADSFGAVFCEVGVDEQTGMLRVRRLSGCYACGTILNAQTARSQFLGGVIFGIGQATHEHAVRDHRTGRIMNDNLAEYHLPVNADVPSGEDFHVQWIDEPDFNASPAGAKGVGEIGITGVAAAIANAVYHATGKRHRELPILPEHLMAS